MPSIGLELKYFPLGLASESNTIILSTAASQKSDASHYASTKEEVDSQSEEEFNLSPAEQKKQKRQEKRKLRIERRAKEEAQTLAQSAKADDHMEEK